MRGVREKPQVAAAVPRDAVTRHGAADASVDAAVGAVGSACGPLVDPRCPAAPGIDGSLPRRRLERSSLLPCASSLGGTSVSATGKALALRCDVDAHGPDGCPVPRRRPLLGRPTKWPSRGCASASRALRQWDYAEVLR
ncbi:hypothetical protein GCM10010515_57350 [Streptomyces fructofermentans]|uniref:Uncharacterized protein n=1 Tax=Streptomyces fructofermentans TaxID=152141 RepID=A0A918NNE3_9ACTN|nr:hypothetical protein GCM10010515_57350 [Streptomyces fructofermentans]